MNDILDINKSLEHPPEVDPALEARREEEKVLISACQNGDLDAFETLVKMYEKKVFWIAFNLVGDQEDAHDLSQEAFLRVFKAIGRFKTQYNFYTWLYRIVVNLAIDHLRKKGKQSKTSLEDCITEPWTDAGPETDLRSAEVRTQIQSVLDSLPAKYKTVIVLRDIHEMSCGEISKIIHCTNATTRWRLHKAREMFKERWLRRVGAVSA